MIGKPSLDCGDQRQPNHRGPRVDQGRRRRRHAAGKVFPVAALPPGPYGEFLALDGYVQLPNAARLATSWVSSGLYWISPSGHQVAIIATFPDAGPADIGYDSRRNRVLVPLFNLDQIVILPL